MTKELCFADTLVSVKYIKEFCMGGSKGKSVLKFHKALFLPNKALLTPLLCLIKYSYAWSVYTFEQHHLEFSHIYQQLYMQLDLNSS